MQADKRRWIYDGMAIPAGIALGERKVAPRQDAPRTQLVRRVLLVGDTSIKTLGAVLRRLLSENGVDLGIACSPTTEAHRWLADGWLLDALGRHSPELILLGLLADAATMGAVDRACAERRATTMWLFQVSALADLAAMAESRSAADYAADAAIVWRSIRAGHSTSSIGAAQDG